MELKGFGMRLGLGFRRRKRMEWLWVCGLKCTCKVFNGITVSCVYKAKVTRHGVSCGVSIFDGIIPFFAYLEYSYEQTSSLLSAVFWWPMTVCSPLGYAFLPMTTRECNTTCEPDPTLEADERKQKLGCHIRSEGRIMENS
ncbi:hypothetical protein L2E82_16186 [Cichorium intybus]|uniref:Uncharacterized protein n=1 Tax=Cichorium intybus TaxID=13427 RepID=A0ACB9F615_CICIN|nr:hypothetical protein L2E82_16186 [Cichorium intybus]